MLEELNWVFVFFFIEFEKRNDLNNNMIKLLNVMKIVKLKKFNAYK